MKTVIVLALRGAPPADFPAAEMGWLLEQHAQLEQAVGPERGWFESHYAAAHALGEQLSRVTGCEVVAGFDNFGIPSIEMALEQAAISAKQVFVITPMLSGTSQHCKVDLPRAIQRVQARHPDTPIVFLWGFDASDLAAFLAAPMNRQFGQTRTLWQPEAYTAGWKTEQVPCQAQAVA